MANLLTYKQPISSYRNEIIGGIVNFMAIAYIVSLNPIIMNADGHGFPIKASITATILTVIVMTLLAGIITKLPLTLAIGLGINSMVVYNVMLQYHLDIPTTLGVVFVSGILLLLISLSRLRYKIIKSIPDIIQVAISAGMGMFILIIGLRNIGLINSNPHTLISIQHINFLTGISCISLLISIIAFIKRQSYAFLLPVIIVSIANLIYNHNNLPSDYIVAPDFSLFNKIDFVHIFSLSLIPAILSIFIVNMLDATSCAVGVIAHLPEEQLKHKQFYLKRVLITDGLGGIFSAFFGTSSAIMFIESTTGIQAGARTGLASIITALLFIPLLFLSPIIELIPAQATAPILIIVGILMINHIRDLHLAHLEDIFVVIITTIAIPFCFSITDGAIIGIISYAVLKIGLGKYKEISPIMLILAIGGVFWLKHL